MKAGKPPKDGSRRYHDRVARQYDAMYEDPYWRFHDEVTWELLKPHLPKNLPAACADLGCGTGKWGFKLLKSGFAVTFADNSAAMVEQVRGKLGAHGPRASRATLTVADIVAMPELPSDTFDLVVGMGDPLSICSDPHKAIREMARITKPGGVVVATLDNKLAFIDHFINRGNADALLEFLEDGKTRWLTGDAREQFELHTFTPDGARRLFASAGFEVLSVTGKTIIPVRDNKKLLEDPADLPRLLRAELALSREPGSAAKAGHLQVTARKPTVNAAISGV